MGSFDHLMAIAWHASDDPVAKRELWYGTYGRKLCYKCGHNGHLHHWLTGTCDSRLCSCKGFDFEVGQKRLV